MNIDDLWSELEDDADQDKIAPLDLTESENLSEVARKPSKNQSGNSPNPLLYFVNGYLNRLKDRINQQKGVEDNQQSNPLNKQEVSSLPSNEANNKPSKTELNKPSASNLPDLWSDPDLNNTEVQEITSIPPTVSEAAISGPASSTISSVFSSEERPTIFPDLHFAKVDPAPEYSQMKQSTRASSSRDFQYDTNFTLDSEQTLNSESHWSDLQSEAFGTLVNDNLNTNSDLAGSIDFNSFEDEEVQNPLSDLAEPSLSDLKNSSELFEIVDFDALLASLQEDASRQAAALRPSVAASTRGRQRKATLKSYPSRSELADALSAYLYRIRQIPLLTTDEEKRLAKLKDEGDEEAKTKLIEANLRLVVYNAHKYIPQTVDLELLDLIQEGNIGLMKAIDRYDYLTGFKVSTYATWWIRQALSRAIADKDRLIRLPVHIHETLSRVNRATRELAIAFGREPSVVELANNMNLPLDKAKQFVSLTNLPISLDQPIDNDDDETTRPGYMARTEAALALGVDPLGLEQMLNIADEVGDIGLINLFELTEDILGSDIEERVILSNLRAIIRNFLASLPERDRNIILLRFGLDEDRGGEQRTLEEIGQQMRLTRERIRQIEAKSLKKLRNSRLGKTLSDYFGKREVGALVSPPDLSVKPPKNRGIPARLQKSGQAVNTGVETNIAQESNSGIESKELESSSTPHESTEAEVSEKPELFNQAQTANEEPNFQEDDAASTQLTMNLWDAFDETEEEVSLTTPAFKGW